jgi:hypothetical protein
MHGKQSPKIYLKGSDRDARIHDAVRLYHYKLQEVSDHLGLHFSTISAIAKQQAVGSLNFNGRPPLADWFRV